jgi:hypothetical protein
LQLAKAGQHLQPIGRRHAVVNDRGIEDRDCGGFNRRLAVRHTHDEVAVLSKYGFEKGAYWRRSSA